MAVKKHPETIEIITDWLGSESGFAIDDAGGIVIEGDPPLELQLTADDQRVVITLVTTEVGAGAGRADAIISTFPDRGTTLHATAAVDRSGVTVTVTNHVYVDGLSRQSFMTALNELVAAIDTIGDPTETKVHEPVTPEDTETAEPETAPAQQATAVTAPQPAGGWAPTHRVPQAGMRAWADPDPSQQPITRLAARVELVIAEKRGDWARVVGSNNWTGWVDARQIQPIGAAAATTAAGESASISLGGIDLRPLPFVGAAAILLSAFLPWWSTGGARTFTSLDVPLSFLWDFNSSGSPYLGWLIIALAVVALVLAVVKKPTRLLMALVGTVAVAATGAFLIQTHRSIPAASDIFDFLGIAPWISLGASVLIIAGAKK